MNPEQISGWFVLLLGMGTVFVGLVVLIALTRIMSALITRYSARKLSARPSSAAERAVANTPPADEPAFVIANRSEFIAAVSAAIAASAGLETAGLRIHSVKQIYAGGGGSRRYETTAAIAAAIAAYTGKDMSGLRIHSVRKI